MSIRHWSHRFRTHSRKGVKWDWAISGVCIWVRKTEKPLTIKKNQRNHEKSHKGRELAERHCAQTVKTANVVFKIQNASFDVGPPQRCVCMCAARLWSHVQVRPPYNECASGYGEGHQSAAQIKWFTLALTTPAPPLLAALNARICLCRGPCGAAHRVSSDCVRFTKSVTRDANVNRLIGLEALLALRRSITRAPTNGCYWTCPSNEFTFLDVVLPRGCYFHLAIWCTRFHQFSVFFQDPQASYDVNGNDMDPMPRYDASNENK